jgi:hypothetical protein
LGGGHFIVAGTWRTRPLGRPGGSRPVRISNVEELENWHFLAFSASSD